MEPFQYLTATTFTARDRTTVPSGLAFSARPDSPVLPVTESRRDRARRLLHGRRAGRRRLVLARPAYR